MLNIADSTENGDGTGGIAFDEKSDGLHVTLVTSGDSKLDVEKNGAVVHTFDPSNVGETVILGGLNEGDIINIITNGSSEELVVSREIKRDVGGSGVTVAGGGGGSSTPTGGTQTVSCTVNGSSTVVVYQGDGSDSTPYSIDNVSELQCIEQNPGAEYELTSNIDASETSEWNSGDGFDGISNFTGKLDGKANTINSLYTTDFGSSQKTGLVRNLGGGEIKNLDIDSATVRVPNSKPAGVVAGYAYPGSKIINVELTNSQLRDGGAAGGFIGRGQGGTTTDILVKDVSAVNLTVDSTPADRRTGGVIGYTRGGVVIQNADLDNVKVTSSDSGGTAGGFIGLAFNEGLGNRVEILNSSIKNPEVIGGNHVGGAIGEGQKVNINNTSVSGGTVESSTANYIGGFAGQLQGNSNVNNTWTTISIDNIDTTSVVGGHTASVISQTEINNSFTAASIPFGSSSDRGGFTGETGTGVTATDAYYNSDTTYSSSSLGTARTTSEMQGSNAVTNMTFDYSLTWKTIAGDYPELQD